VIQITQNTDCEKYLDFHYIPLFIHCEEILLQFPIYFPIQNTYYFVIYSNCSLSAAEGKRFTAPWMIFLGQTVSIALQMRLPRAQPRIVQSFKTSKIWSYTILRNNRLSDVNVKSVLNVYYKFNSGYQSHSTFRANASRQKLSFGGHQSSLPPCRQYAKFTKNKV